MPKRLTDIAMIIGSLLLGFSVALPAVTVSNSNIIGGADLPTFFFHFRQTAWMAIIGIAVIAVAMFIRHKK